MLHDRAVEIDDKRLAGLVQEAGVRLAGGEGCQKRKQ